MVVEKTAPKKQKLLYQFLAKQYEKEVQKATKPEAKEGFAKLAALMKKEAEEA